MSVRTRSQGTADAGASIARVALLLLMGALAAAGGCASRLEFPAPSSNLSLSADLRRPEAGGPLPAVVLLASCAGVTPHLGEWASWLSADGYVTLVVDSFRPRHSRTACLGGSPTVDDMARDAIDALAYLQTLPFVDGSRVAVMGWSHGGGAALQASGGHARSGSVGPLAFKAAVAFYPPCALLDVRTSTPTLLLLGGQDDWTPSGPCVAMGELARRADRPVRWQVYANATHAFDWSDARPAFGHEMAYDRAATSAAREAVQRFLAEQMRPRW